MFKQSLQLKLGQSLTMTPQLQQAIRLLQMPTAELQAHISELLETNVMLEQEEPEEEELAVPFAELDPRTTQAEEPSTPEVEIIDEPWADRVGTSSDSAGAGSADDDDRQKSPTGAAKACAITCSPNLNWRACRATTSPPPPPSSMR